jgi:hypothetical protein
MTVGKINVNWCCRGERGRDEEQNEFHGKRWVAKIFLKADGSVYFAAHLLP